jgi:hypothetical protein
MQSMKTGPPTEAVKELPTSKLDITFDAMYTRFAIRFPIGNPILSKANVLETLTGSLADMLVANQLKQQRAIDFEACFVIGPNGDITMSDQHVTPSTSSNAAAAIADDQNAKNGEEFKQKLSKLARYLDIAGDLDLWVEQIKWTMLPKEP